MRQLYTLILLSICFVASSCDKDQRVLDSLDGTWQIKRVTHLEQDTTKLPSSGTITFSKCELGQGNCPASYTLEGQEMVQANFHVAEKGKLVGIFGLGYPYSLSDQYKVVQRNQDRLELEGTISVIWRQAKPTPQNKLVKVNILLER